MTLKKELFEAIAEEYRKYRESGPKAISNFSRFKAGFIAGIQYSTKEQK